MDFVPEVTFSNLPVYLLRIWKRLNLAVEEAEALRLKDIEGLEQEECAQRNETCHARTFARVLGAARHKTADALLNGKAIRIEGGNFETTVRRYRCINGHRWDVPSKDATAEEGGSCPTCENPAIVPAIPHISCRGRGRKGRGGHHHGGRNPR